MLSPSMIIILSLGLLFLSYSANATDIVIKYKWDASNPNFDGKVTINWSENGQCTGKSYLNRGHATCDVPTGQVTVQEGNTGGDRLEQPLSYIVEAQVPFVSTCDAYISIYPKIIRDDTRWFHLGLDNICCDKSCKKNPSFPKITCSFGPSGQVLQIDGSGDYLPPCA